MTITGADLIETAAWQAVRSSGELISPSGRVRLEPRVMDLLFLLASRSGEVVARDEIMTALWPGVVVSEDTLARTVFKLRKALDDDPKSPRYIETIPKRGYRYVQARAPAPRYRFPVALGVAAALVLAAVAAGAVLTLAPAADAASRIGVARANDYYFQYSYPDNEAAIELYQRIIDTDPDYAPAYAGLANALVQRVIRWPTGARARALHANLASALRGGYARSPNGQWTLGRARALAEQAVRLAPGDPASHKALGFVFSAQEDFDEALASYHRAVALDQDAWGPLINIADVLEISGREDQALPYLERAYAAMTRRYDRETARIRPWYAETAVLIGDRHRDRGDDTQAALWYRRVLDYAPFHASATARTVELLERSGDVAAARKLCAAYVRRIGRLGACEPG